LSISSRVEDIFVAALGKGTPREREAFLDAECAGDAELRLRVERLLQAQANTHSAPQHGAGAQPTADEPQGTAVEGVGSLVGPYKILQRLGQGGMGTVWVAEQQQPVKRRVALKVIKPGMDSATVVHRFEAERQALALMDHPNIAKVFEAGTTAAGRPYFAMELVPGMRITQYCDELNLPIRARLALCVGVCRAVQHAHQKGVIHRDLKPSNILVCIQDGQPLAKVIDFGVAKALHQRLTDATIYTEFGALIGTLEYMSPEQAEMSPLGVDTRADVYALGVLLYELLTGSTPLDRKRLRDAPYSELVRILKEEEPPKPSTRLTQSKESLSTLAARRRCEPERLRKDLRGELDWIVMKCLEKDRTCRYESASALAQDLESYLADRPVAACPPSKAYLARKFMRRHRGAVSAAALTLLLLLAGIVGTTWGLIQAEAARQEAEQARNEAQARAQDALAAQARADAAADKERKARAAESAQRQLAEDQRRVAEANERRAVEQQKIADAVRNFLQNDLLKQANAISQANAALAAGRAPDATANPTVKELLDRAAGELTPAKIQRKFPDQGEVQASILETIGHAYNAIGEYARGVELLRRAHDTYREALGADHPTTLAALHGLAEASRRVGKAAEAANLLEQVRDLRAKRFGADSPQTIDTVIALGGIYRSLGRLDEAIAALEQASENRTKRLGAEHAATLQVRSILALAYRDAGKRSEAIAILEHIRDVQMKKAGPKHPYTLGTLNNLALSYTDAGRPSEAIAILEKVRDTRVRVFGANHPETINTLEGLAEAHEAGGDLKAALAVYQETMALIEKRDFQYTFTGAVIDHMSGCLEKLKRFADAESWRRRLVDLTRTRDGPQSLDYALALTGLGQTLILEGKHSEAEPVLREAWALQTRQQPEAWRTFHAEALLGSALLGQQKYAEAEPRLRNGYEGMKARAARILRADENRPTAALECLVRLYEAWGKPLEATKWRKQLVLTPTQK
jgi:serine/threonine protein kinase